jgi:hypothetical protein
MSDCIDSCVTRFAAEEDAIEEEEGFCGVGTGVLEADCADGLGFLLPSLLSCPM